MATALYAPAYTANLLMGERTNSSPETSMVEELVPINIPFATCFMYISELQKERSEAASATPHPHCTIRPPVDPIDGLRNTPSHPPITYTLRTPTLYT